MSAVVRRCAATARAFSLLAAAQFALILATTHPGLAAARTHALTYAVLGPTFRGGVADAAPYIDWVESARFHGGVAAYQRAGVKISEYRDPARISTYSISKWETDASVAEDAYVHCSRIDAAHRILTTYDGGKTLQLLGDLGSPALWAGVDAGIAADEQHNGARDDATRLDDMVVLGDGDLSNLYVASTGLGGTKCGSFVGTAYPYDLSSFGAYSDAHSLAALQALATHTSVPVWITGLGISNVPGHLSLAMPLMANSNVVGATYEYLFEDNCGCHGGRNHKEIDPFWTAGANTALAIVHSHHKKIVAADYTNNDVDRRGYLMTSLLLVFEPNQVGYMELNPPPSGLPVQPEFGLVPSDALQTAKGDIAELRDAGGVYRREFGRCSLWGVAQGPCAAVINPDPKRSLPLPALSRQYRHTLAISGSGVLRKFGDDGNVRANGAAVPRELGPQTWAVLFR